MSEKHLSFEETANILNLLFSLDKLEKAIVEALVKVFPQSVNITNLTELVGYSYKSKHLSRSHILEKLENLNIIKIHTSHKSKVINLNLNNEIIKNLTEVLLETNKNKVDYNVQNIIERQKNMINNVHNNFLIYDNQFNRRGLF